MVPVSAKPSCRALRSSASHGPLGALRGARGAEPAALWRWLLSLATPGTHFTHLLGECLRLQTRSSPQAPLSPAQPSQELHPALPKVTWASPQSRRPAAGAGVLCSSLSSWLRPEVRFTEPGHWGRARGEISGWGEWVAGQMGYPGSPLQPAGYPPSLSPQAGRLLGLLGGGSGGSAQCPGWVVGTSLCSDGRSSSC